MGWKIQNGGTAHARVTLKGYKGVATHFSRVLNTQVSRNSKKGFFGRLIKQFSCRKYGKQRGDLGILRATFEQRFEKFWPYIIIFCFCFIFILFHLFNLG